MWVTLQKFHITYTLLQDNYNSCISIVNHVAPHCNLEAFSDPCCSPFCRSTRFQRVTKIVYKRLQIQLGRLILQLIHCKFLILYNQAHNENNYFSITKSLIEQHSIFFSEISTSFLFTYLASHTFRIYLVVEGEYFHRQQNLFCSVKQGTNFANM